MRYDEIDAMKDSICSLMNKSSAWIDETVLASTTERLRSLYVRTRTQVAQLTGNYSLPEFERWTSEELEGSIHYDTLKDSLRRLRLAAYRVEVVERQIQINKLSGKHPWQQVNTRYRVQETFPKAASTAPLQWENMHHRARKIVGTPPGRTLYLAGYISLNCYILAQLSRDKPFQQDLQGCCREFAKANLSEYEPDLQYRMVRSLLTLYLGQETEPAKYLNALLVDQDAGPRDEKELNALMRKFESTYLMATGFLATLKDFPNWITVYGREVKPPYSHYLPSVLASDVCSIGHYRMLTDDRLKSLGFEPHLLFYDDLLFSVPEDVDEEFVQHYVNECYTNQEFPDLEISCVKGKNWYDAVENRRLAADF